MIGIYKITSPSGKIYIGQSVDIKYRWSQYNTQSSNRKLKESFETYGLKNHTFEVLEECDRTLLNERERYWQDFYDVLGENGLNLVLIGTTEKRTVISEETRKVCSEANKSRVDFEENKKKLSSYRNGGTFFSEKHKENLCKNNWMNKKVINTETGEVFLSITSAAKSIGMENENLRNRLNGVVKKNDTNFKFYTE